MVTKEIKRRLKILDDCKVPVITARLLRGGMQKRLHRQEAIRYGNNVKNQRKNLNRKLSLIEEAKSREMENELSLQSSSAEELEDFNEPVFKRIRSQRGFF